MSIEVMKQALEALETLNSGDSYKTHNAASALRQAIEEAEKPWVKTYAGGKPNYTTPVHASDMSQEPVDETAKRKHEWVGLDGDIPGLGLVTEEFYNGMLCAEDILRKRNT
jgi:hypothetical protein